jgi:hypothetical protein
VIFSVDNEYEFIDVHLVIVVVFHLSCLPVNYRRQSITPKLESNHTSRKTSIHSITDTSTVNVHVLSSNDKPCSTCIDSLNDQYPLRMMTLSPILSPKQRSLILHQWREIMSEEISLRHYQQYLEQQQIHYEQLEKNLKSLKMKIFSTNHDDDVRHSPSLLHIDSIEHGSHHFWSQRSQSLQSLVSMPTSWVLAVRSAAYSDVLDGTSMKTTKQAILFNKTFFDQLEQFKHDRRQCHDDSIRFLEEFDCCK